MSIPDAGAPGGEEASVARPVADLRADPDPGAELVNQALLGTPALVLERRPGADGREWARVALPDYSGWMLCEDLAPEPGVDVSSGAAGVVRVVVPRASVEVGGARQTVYAGTALRVIGDAGPSTLEVLMPGARRGLIEARAVRPAAGRAQRQREAVVTSLVEAAHEYLETPYLWGGLTREGIDCSGFVQTIYRVHGYTIPRDADQQFEQLPHHVERGEWLPGDLLYLGPAPEKITHVGMYVGNNKVIHAARPHVVVHSVDNGDPDYSARWDEEYQGARRVIE